MRSPKLFQRRSIERIVTALLALFLLASAAHAGAADWRYLPIWGGDVRSVAVHPEDPELVLAGTSAGQLYLSRNGGRTWANAGSHLPFPGWVVSTLRFDPNDPNRVWAALRGIWGGGHVASSDDLGKTWASRSQGIPAEEPVYTLAPVKGKPGWIYAGTLSGVYGTEDGGATWRRLTAELAEMQKVTSLLTDPEKPETVIAGTWRRAYRSDDGGNTWTGVFQGMALDSEVFSLTPVAGRPGEIWASTCGFVYQTLDGGANWAKFTEGLKERRTPSFSALPSGRLLAGTVAGLHVSDDGGKTWRLVGDPGISIQSIAYHPKNPDRVIFGTEGSGIWVSEDGGTTLRPSSAGLINTRISAFAKVEDELMVAVSHAGPFSGIYSSRDAGKTFPGFIPLPTVLDIAVHQGRIFAATEQGLFERRGGGWHWVRDIGTGRVEQFISEGPRLLARTPDALYELKGKIFTRRPVQGGVPRSAAFYGDSLWVSDAKAVYRLTSKENQPVQAPFPGGRLQPVEGQLLLWGNGGVFARTAEGDWAELVREPSRLLPTGDDLRPALVVSGDSVRLFDRRTRKLQDIDVPVPARDISAARVVGNELLIGTSGYGVLVRVLGPAGEGVTTAGAGK
ncbi:MAG: WD40/YVTN/BNR-like repeat-containing protein [Thermoanaerobaculia bacterium]